MKKLVIDNSFGENCQTCKYVVAVGSFLECHRFPPAYNKGVAVWPRVNRYDWCGEWKMDEETKK